MAHPRSERAKLEQKRERILAKIASLNPSWVLELRAVDLEIAMLDVPPGQRYASFRNPKPAIEAVLTEHQRWMTAIEIAKELEAGGYPMHPQHGIRQMLHSIRVSATRGTLQRVEDLFGLLGWESPVTKDFGHK